MTLSAPPTSHPESARDAPRATGRDPFFDNAKFLLVVLVVVGHNWGALPRDIPVVKAAYCVVYLFHMPAFILLCGYFSRGFTGRADQIRALIARVLLPYLFFTVAYRALYALLWDVPLSLTLTEPTYLLWFLMALFLWRITAPAWRAVRFPVGIAVLISLVSGLMGMGYDLALPRVLMFLPWFVAGLRLREGHFRRLRGRAARGAAVSVLAAALGCAYALTSWTNVGWLHMQYDNTQLHIGPLGYLAARLALFAASGCLVAAFFALVPARKTAFSVCGAATMFPFLTHGLLVQTGKAYGLYDLLGALGPATVLVTTGLGIAMALALAGPRVRRVLRPVVEPRFPRWLTPAGDARDRTAATGNSKDHGARTA